MRGRAETADATKQAIKDELGDILWYAVTIAKRAKLNFQRDVLHLNLTRLTSAYPRIEMFRPFSSRELKPGGKVDRALNLHGVRAVDTFDAYQSLAVLASKYRDDKAALVPYLVQIWKNSGELLSSHLRWLNGETENRLAVAKSLGDVMWYVAGFAHLYGLSLSDIAADNLEKIMSAFP